MKIFTYLSVFATLISTQHVFSQYSISGVIKGDSNQNIAYSNVLLYMQKDSTFVDGTISEEDGGFFFKDISSGAYFVKVSFVGFQEKKRAFTLDADVELPPIILLENSSELEAVNISAKKPEIRKEADRIVFDIENTSLSSGNTWDVLQKAPGVINIQNDLKIRNTSATVYINDKKVDLTSDELRQLLESYSAENIKQIEVIRNPPAKYDAGDGPILNIVTTKMLVPGYKGSINGSYTQGIYPKYNIGTSHYYKNEKLNIFGNYSFSPAKRFKEDKSYINFINEENEIFSKWRTDFDRTTQEKNHNANFMLDYTLDENNLLSFSGTGLYTPEKSFNNRGKTNIYSASNQLDSLFTTHSNLNNDVLNVAYDVTYRHQFKESTLLAANFHSTYFDETKQQHIQTNYFSPEENLLNENFFSTDASQKINIYAGQLDFETVFGEYNFSAGTKYSRINSTSQINFYNVESDAATFENSYLSDKFDYDESVFAVYSSLAKDWEKWSTKLGLRVEHTDREGESFSLNQINSRTYTELFPSLYLNYQAAENHSFSFDYGRKISRPKYESLNPFRYFINENNYQSGNPNLRAAISNEFNLNYTLQNKYSFDFYYRDNGKNIAQLVFQDNQNLFLRSVQANMLESKSYGIDFFHGRSLKSWWYSQAIMSAFHEEETFLAIESNNAEVTNDVDAFYASLYNGFTLSKDGSFSGDLTLLYISSFIQGSYQVDDIFNLSVGVRKTIWNNRGELSLHLSDLFNELAPNLNSTYLNQDNGYYALPENRYVRIGFKYKFGNFNLSDNERAINAEERERL